MTEQPWCDSPDWHICRPKCNHRWDYKTAIQRNCMLCDTREIKDGKTWKDLNLEEKVMGKKGGKGKGGKGKGC